MYATCLFCTSDLGRNEVIERFPVGHRLAFDAARGRLWVVCRKCGRWNLSPLEERWEAVEECERRFRGTRLRVSTDQIGLARVAGGLELVRVGRPLRPEFAAWRYGDQFGRRRRRTIAMLGGATAAGGMLWATGGIALVTALVPGAGVAVQMANWVRLVRNHARVVDFVPDANGVMREVRLEHVPRAELVRTGEAPWALRVHHDRGSTVLHGKNALRVGGRLMAHLNQTGAFQRTVAGAVARLEDAGGPEALMSLLARPDRGRAGPPRAQGVRKDFTWPAVDDAIRRLSTVDRLALEMAMHEETERRVLEGELAALEDEWREAEEIAAIADRL